MELYQLKIFKDLATELSFVRAAQLNFITQPAVSSQIKRLEQELGLKLLERTPRRVSLTNEGRLILPYAEEILRSSQNLMTLSGEVVHRPGGEVKIASIHSIGMYEIGPLLKRFLLVCPKIHVRLQYLQSAEIYELLIKKKIDLGIVAYSQPHPLIQITPFGTDRLVLIVPPTHRLANKQRVNLSQIDGESFIAFDEGLPTREAIDDMLRSAKIAVDIRMTNDNIYAIKSAVQANIGISFVPESTVREELRHGMLKSLVVRGAQSVRPRSIVTHKKRALSKAAALFMDSMKSFVS